MQAESFALQLEALLPLKKRLWQSVVAAKIRQHATVLQAATGGAAGLLPIVGIHHHNLYNAFCLADDLMEPYRPYVDWRVKKLASENAAMGELTRENKAALLSLFNEIIPIGGRHTPLLLAFHSTAASLGHSFRQGEAALALPEGLPIQTGEIPDEDPKEPVAP